VRHSPTKATNFIEKECSEANPGFIGLVVLVKLVWVAENCYAASHEDISAIVRQIPDSRQLVVQHAESVWQALSAFEKAKVDFGDCLVARLAAAKGCTKTITFDKKATRVGVILLT
jgi:predicted nucleic-acid-binding protein